MSLDALPRENETARRSRRMRLMWHAGDPLPGARTPMTPGQHERMQRCILHETLALPEPAEIRALCHLLAHQPPEEAPE